MHLTMIFIDGLGLGAQQDNPVTLARTPCIDKLLGGHYLWGDRRIRNGNCSLFPLDATLGVSGIPQSATGQTALWTGINTARLLGCHLNAYPNKELKEVIEVRSIFKILADKGKKVTFANAFTKNYEQLITAGIKRHSASTLCALAGGVKLRRSGDLLKGKAVYQDITNEIFRKKGEEVPLNEPSQAGKNLAGLSLEHDFTLFEYFQTDISGHKRDSEKAILTMETLDKFIGGYLSIGESVNPIQNRMAFILTSDHGNIEDLSTSHHTLNKVPALCWSNFNLKWPEIKSITEVTPTILQVLDNLV